MTTPEKTELTSFTTPFKRQVVTLSGISHDNDLNLFEIKIREQRRFTMLELDPEHAEKLVQVLQEWLKENS